MDIKMNYTRVKYIYIYNLRNDSKNIITIIGCNPVDLLRRDRYRVSEILLIKLYRIRRIFIDGCLKNTRFFVILDELSRYCLTTEQFKRIWDTIQCYKRNIYESKHEIRSFNNQDWNYILLKRNGSAIVGVRGLKRPRETINYAKWFL